MKQSAFVPSARFAWRTNARMTFLPRYAHELRNPLAPIAMGLELMKVSLDDQQAMEEVRSMIERQTQLMVRLIDDLLDVSRITARQARIAQARSHTR